jgi:hypothetical protein
MRGGRESEGCQDPGGVPGVVAACRGGAGVARHFQDSDAEVAQGSPESGQDLRRRVDEGRHTLQARADGLPAQHSGT